MLSPIVSPVQLLEQELLYFRLDVGNIVQDWEKLDALKDREICQVHHGDSGIALQIRGAKLSMYGSNQSPIRRIVHPGSGHDGFRGQVASGNNVTNSSGVGFVQQSGDDRVVGRDLGVPH